MFSDNDRKNVQYKGVLVNERRNFDEDREQPTKVNTIMTWNKIISKFEINLDERIVTVGTEHFQ